MLSVPAGFTAFQGFDALFHSIEGYIANGANLMSDMYALTAVENLAKYLPRAVKDGGDLEGPYTCGLCQHAFGSGHVPDAYHQ